MAMLAASVLMAGVVGGREESAALPVFADGFEIGNTCSWSRLESDYRRMCVTLRACHAETGACNERTVEVQLPECCK